MAASALPTPAQARALAAVKHQRWLSFGDDGTHTAWEVDGESIPLTWAKGDGSGLTPEGRAVLARAREAGIVA